MVQLYQTEYDTYLYVLTGNEIVDTVYILIVWVHVCSFFSFDSDHTHAGTHTQTHTHTYTHTQRVTGIDTISASSSSSVACVHKNTPTHPPNWL